MGLIQNLQGQQPQQQAGNDDAMHASMMEMLGATLLGDGGQAVAGRLQAGEDKIQAKEAGRSVPAQQIVKAVYAGCREMLASGKIGDPDSKIDALFRAMDKLKEMDAENDVIDDQILAEASQILQAIVQKMDEAEQQGDAA